MCFLLPYKIKSIKGKKATIVFNKEKQIIDISLVKNLRKGDYILSQNSVAVKKISKKEANKVLQLIG